MNKLDRVNKGKWWRMEHPAGSTAKFTVTQCGRLTRDKTPNNVMMRLEVYGPGNIEKHVQTNGKTHTLSYMRREWNRLAKRGFVYNAD